MGGIEKKVMALIKHYSPYGERKTILLNTDFRTGLDMIWEDVNDMMGDYFTDFAVEPANYQLIDYFPEQKQLNVILARLKLHPKLVPPPYLTPEMLIESAKAGRWLY